MNILSENKLVLGIDIGGTNIHSGLVTPKGRVIKEFNLKTQTFSTPNHFIAELHQLVLAYLDSHQYKLTGIGVGAPNGNYYSGSIEFAPNLPWKGSIHLSDLLNEVFKVPVKLSNDANCAAVGEFLFGNGKNCTELLVITLGTGVGSGFISNGQILLGHDGFAGELGHIIIEKNGRSCGCGRRGCLETYTSATGVVRTALELLSTSTENSMLKNKSTSEITAEFISESAEKGDTISKEILLLTADYLGLALSHAVAITSPKKIILFGGLSKSTFLREQTKIKMESYLLPIFQNKIELQPSGISGHAAILGASALVQIHKD